jgi:hypothetical protein
MTEGHTDKNLREIIRDEMKTYRRAAVIGYCILFLGFGLGYATTQNQWHESQKDQNAITLKQARIKADSITQRCELTSAIIAESTSKKLNPTPLLDDSLEACRELEAEAKRSISEAEERLVS